MKKYPPGTRDHYIVGGKLQRGSMQFVMFIDLFSKGFKLLLVVYTDVIFISYTVFLILLGTRYKHYHCRTN
jgi:TRAP-type C4-dicarboxylate transport system permease small subunit